MSKVLIIARLTFQEAARKRILIIGVVLTAIFLSVYWTGVHFITESIQQDRGESAAIDLVASQFETAFFFNMGLFMANMIIAMVAVFTAGGTIATEIEQATLHTIVTRPISRARLIIGKWLGHAVLLSLYSTLLYGSIVAIIYFEGGWLPDHFLAGGALFIGVALVVLSATIFGSTLVSGAANSVIVLLLFMTAMIGGITEQIGAILGRDSLVTTGVISGLLMPTDPMYRYAVNMMKPDMSALGVGFSSVAADFGPFGAASAPSATVIIYAAVFSLALLAGAIAVFNRRDL